jgi:protein-disulfide isomerase
MMGFVRHRNRWVALTSLVVLGSGIGALLAFRKPAVAAAASTAVAATAPDPDPLIAQRSKGSATAPITIYEMSDFQCPYCQRQALDMLPVLEKEFIATGKVRWVFLNLPLTDIHANAVAAHELAMCAARIDKFWPIHDLLFTYQKKWGPLKDPGAFMMSLADSAGIAHEDIAPCLESGEMRGLIRSESEGAAKSGVASTPTVYVEGAGLIRGAQPIEVYRMILDSLYADKIKKN